MNTYDLEVATNQMKGKNPDDLKTMLKAHFADLGNLEIFVRYMVYLAAGNIEKLLALHRMKIILEQHPKETHSSDLLAFVAKEIEHWEYRQLLEKEFTNKTQHVPINAQEFNKIKFKGNLKQLTTLFYELHNQMKFDTSKENLQNWIVACFLDKNGKPLNPDTVEMYLREDQELNRVDGKKRIQHEKFIGDELS